jgi:2-polyprenyl-3-methyl-5-hydroxy-6-metoxy-1,4-benzoquinol methylase
MENNENIENAKVIKNISAEVPWFDKEIKRFKDLGTMIPNGQKHIYKKIRDFWVGGRTVLDIGCSLGVGANILSHDARFVWAIDVNEQAINFGKEVFARPNLDFELVDIQNPTTRELAKFEVITMIEVLEHLDDPAMGIAFIKRMLSGKDGVAFVTVPNRNNESIKERDDTNDLHLTHWTAGSFYEFLIKHFASVTLYAGERLTDFGSQDTIDGNSDCQLVLAKLEGAL